MFDPLFFHFILSHLAAGLLSSTLSILSLIAQIGSSLYGSGDLIRLGCASPGSLAFTVH